MPRRAKPWFRTSANAWYVKVNGKQTSLGVAGEANESEALNAWHRLMANGRSTHYADASVIVKPTNAPSTPVVSVGDVVDAFLADAQGRVSSECLRKYKHCLLPFKDRFGERKAETLTPSEAETYARQSRWSASYRNGILGSVVTAFRWAERQRLLAVNPMQGVRKPPKASRGAKSLIDADAHAKLCRHAPPLLRAFLQLLWHTGARPGEIASLRMRDVDAKQGVAVLHEHKTAHIGKQRMVFLSPKALTILRTLAKGVGDADALLFRGVSVKAFGLRLWRLCKSVGVPNTMLYGYRHTFATTALASGVPDAHVAALLGHSSTAMLHKQYGHLTAYAQTLRNALASVR